MRVYIVTKNDYRYVNGRFFPVDTFDTDIRNALYHIHILVGVYDSLTAAEAAVDENIRVQFNINEVIDNYKSSIQIRKYYFGDNSKLHEKIDVILPDSDGLSQIQMTYNITIKDFEVPADDDKKGIQLKDLKSEDIDSIAEEAAEKLSENEEFTVVDCFIDDKSIDFVDHGNRHTSVELSKDDDGELYNDHLLYMLADRTNIYTHFYDLRERKPGHNLVIELSGVYPYKDDSDPLKETSIKVYRTDAVKERECIYEKQYLVDIYDDENIINDFSCFSIANLNLNEYDNLYIIDRRVRLTEKDNPKEESIEDNKKAIECTISISDNSNNDTLMIFKFKIDGTCSTKSLSKVATNSEDFIRYLKQYTDGYTKFIDERVGPSWIAFYNRISYDCHIIEMDDRNITLKHNNSKYKTERKCFEEILDQIKDANIIYIRDETAL